MADTDVADVRHLIADLDPDARMFTDEQVGTYLRLNGGAVRLAAADMLDAIAVSEVLVSKVIRTQDLSTDGAKVADSLMKRAASLRSRHAADTAGDEEGVFLITSMGGRPDPAELASRQVWGL